MNISSEMILKVLTFNVWGLPGFISENKEERMKAICSALKELDNVDVICLQEVWIEKDYLDIKNALQGKMPYSHYFYSGVTGSGVCVFTRWPIIEILFHQWPLNGYIHMVHHGDWFGGKGVGLVVLNVNGFNVNIYTTHLHAQYHRDDSYLVHRVEQAFDTAMFIRLTSAHSDFSILAGDLNTPPGSLCERLLLLVADLSDSYEAHDMESTGGTNDCCRNSYSNPNLVSFNPNGLRIDYILYKSSPHIISEIQSYRFPLSRRIPHKDFSYSDHEAILAQFHVSRSHISKNQSPSVSLSVTELKSALTESIALCSSALYETNMRSIFYWAISLTLFCCILMTPLVFDYPLLHSLLFLILLIFVIAALVGFVLMATIWSKLEFHAILGVRERMIVLFHTLTPSS